MKINYKKMLSNGFTIGTIHSSKEEGDCLFTIKVEDKESTYFLDPINLTEEYKKKGKKIWFKFSRLRRVNRCEKATPIHIIEIKKRE